MLKEETKSIIRLVHLIKINNCKKFVNHKSDSLERKAETLEIGKSTTRRKIKIKKNKNKKKEIEIGIGIERETDKKIE